MHNTRLRLAFFSSSLHGPRWFMIDDASGQRSNRHALCCRSEPEDQFGDVTYDIRIMTSFKTEEGVDYPESITIATAANAALCGIYLEVGNEYLLDLFRYALESLFELPGVQRRCRRTLPPHPYSATSPHIIPPAA